MTTTTFGPSRPVAAEERRLPLAPAEGWTTLGLVLLLCLTLAWSIDDASWVIGPRGLTDFLAWAIVLGVGWGFVSAKVGWPRWQAHLLGAVFAALLVPMIVGSRLIVGGGPVDWFQATAAAVVDAWTDLAVEGLPFTTQVGHFMLVLGLLAWATGQYAGYVTFHHRRPLNAVIVIGVALVVNMSLTLRDQLIYLVIYSLASLFLLIRLHAYDERTVWIRHRIGDAASLGGLYLRGGSVFVASAVILALFLTSAASSSPLAPLWSGVDQRLIDVGQEVQRVLGAGGGSTRLSSVDFGDSAVISGQWTTDSTPVLDIQVPPKSPAYYWRAVSYDKFNGRAWLWSQTTNVVVPAGAPAMSGIADDPAGLPDRQDVTFTGPGAQLQPEVDLRPGHPGRGRHRLAADRGSGHPRGHQRDGPGLLRRHLLRRVRRVHGHRQRPDRLQRRPGPRPNRQRAARRRDRLPGQRQGALPQLRRDAHRTGDPQADGGDPGRPPGGHQEPVRHGAVDHELPQVRGWLHLQLGRHERRLRRRPAGRVLRPDEAGLLPLLREHARTAPPLAGSRPGWPRASCPGRAPATRRPSSRAAHTPGSRSTSRATAGRCSTRPGDRRPATPACRRVRS